MTVAPPQSSLEDLLEGLPAVYFRQDRQGKVESVAGGTSRLLGLEEKDLLTEPSKLLSAIHPDDRERYEAVQGAGEPRTVRFRLWHARTGELKTIQEVRKVVLDKHHTALGFEGLWMDKTAEALIERRLEAGAWKEILCRLTQGFAHDFNNALTAIISMGDLLLAQADEKHAFHQPLVVLKQGSQRASDLVRRLSQLLSSGPEQPGFCDVGKMVSEVLGLLEKAVPRRVTVKSQVDAGCLAVFADAWKLRLVLFQLVTNGLEAMPDGGTLTVEVKRVVEGPDRAAAAGKLGIGPWVRVGVADSGPGFPPDRDVFEPWFSTKPQGRGTGLGLFLVRKFCEESGGAVFLGSGDQGGGRVELWLAEANLDAPEAEILPEPRKCLLVSASRAEQGEELARLCRAGGYVAVHCPELGNVNRLLAANAAEFDAMILVGETEQSERILKWIAREKLKIQTVLLTPNLEAAGADLVVNEQGTLLKRLRDLLGP